MRLPLATALLLLAGCTGPLAQLRRTHPVAIQSSRFELRYSDPDVDQTERLSASLGRATAALQRWGPLPQPVTVHVVPTHEALEEAVRRPGYGWLRAWARYDDVILQSPRTWSGGPKDVRLDELLLHELTHCLLFQRSGNGLTWMTRGIPMWFREGMATNTAHQGQRFPSLEDLSLWVQSNRELDVFADGDALSRDAFEEVYGLAHHAFAFLSRRYGDAAINATIAHMGEGLGFSEAFERAVGVPLAKFEGDFLTWLRLKGFRGHGLNVNGWRHRPERLPLRPVAPGPPAPLPPSPP